MARASLSAFVILTACACGGADVPKPVVPVSPSPAPDEGRIVAHVASPPPKPVVPFALPPSVDNVSFASVLDQPPIVAKLGDHVVVVRRLRRCVWQWGKLKGGWWSCGGAIDAIDGDGKPAFAPLPFEYPYTTIVGERLLGAQSGSLALYDLRNGLRVDAVSDPVLGSSVCVDAPRDRLFVTAWDDPTRDAIVDLATMKVRPRNDERCPAPPAPPYCDARTSVACLSDRDESIPPIAIADFHPTASLRAAGDLVLLGNRARGRKLPMIAAIDPVTRKARWSALVPAHDAQPRAAEAALYPHHFVDMAGGRIFIEYDAWVSHPHLAAFDVKTGARLWDVAIDAFVAFTPTADRVFLTDPAGTLALDAATGSRV